LTIQFKEWSHQRQIRMRFPKLQIIEFVILAHLLPGGSPASALKKLLHDTYGWQPTAFYSIIKRMADAGLIDVHRSASTDGGEVRQRSWYEITEVGRLHWRETFGFFLSVSEAWKPAADSIPAGAVPELKKLTSVAGRAEVRVANSEEAELIVREAAPEFARIFAVSRDLGVLLIDLISSKVEDFSPSNMQLRIVLPAIRPGAAESEYLLSVSDAVAKLIRIAIDGRQNGPIFLSPQGKQWEEVNLRMHFSRLRRKLGFSPNVMMQDARAKTGLRLNESSDWTPQTTKRSHSSSSNRPLHRSGRHDQHFKDAEDEHFADLT
jgi:DNA-binding PadR family transcriptional regulator